MNLKNYSMESKKRFKKRSLNEYRQSKDYGYSNSSQHKSYPKKHSKHKRFYDDVKEANRTIGNDQELGGYVRRLLRRFYDRFGEE